MITMLVHDIVYDQNSPMASTTAKEVGHILSAFIVEVLLHVLVNKTSMHLLGY